jgi:hypothetical protein
MVLQSMQKVGRENIIQEYESNEVNEKLGKMQSLRGMIPQNVRHKSMKKGEGKNGGCKMDDDGVERMEDVAEELKKGEEENRENEASEITTDHRSKLYESRSNS